MSSHLARLFVQREKFAQHLMVSAGACFSGKCRSHFVVEKSKDDSAYYVDRLLRNLVENCTRLLPTGFIFRQDGAPSHTARFTQDWIHPGKPSGLRCQKISRLQIRQTFPMDYHITSAIQNQKQIVELKEMLQSIWDR